MVGKKCVSICVSVSSTALGAEDQKLKVDGQALSEVELFTAVPSPVLTVAS